MRWVETGGGCSGNVGMSSAPHLFFFAVINSVYTKEMNIIYYNVDVLYYVNLSYTIITGIDCVIVFIPSHTIAEYISDQVFCNKTKMIIISSIPSLPACGKLVAVFLL